MQMLSNSHFYRLIQRVLITRSLILFCGYSSLEGKDLGIQGEIFTLEEESLIAILQRKATQAYSEKDQEGLLKQLHEKARNPQSLLVPPEARSRKTYYYDPTFTLEESIVDRNGSVLFLKGTRVNPLQHTTLLSGLLFLDGTNLSHLAWARSQQGSFKWILVQGNPFELEEKENRPVYFDQQGFSVSKFKIEHIPARVTQEGLLLKIEEIPSDEEEY